MLDRGIQIKRLDCPVKPDNDNHYEILMCTNKFVTHPTLFTILDIPQKICKDGQQIRDEKLKRLKSDIEEVERMLKALIKSLENKHLTP